MTDLADIIASIERLGTLAEDVAKRAAPLVEDALRATAKAGTAPDGTPWKPKKDRGAPLVHAGDAITVKAVGTVVRATLTGPTVFHHFGSARNPRRPVLPDPGSLPPPVAKAIEKAADQAFAKATQ